MKKSHSLLMGLAILTILASPYRVEIVGAAINAVKKLKIDLAAGNIPVVASSTDTGAVETAMLESGLQPSHVVKFSGFANWTGHAASYKLAIFGVLSTDIIQSTIWTAPTEAAYIKATTLKNNTGTFTLSTANTSDDAVISYTVYRAAP